jgi:hypothetical protein
MRVCVRVQAATTPGQEGLWGAPRMVRIACSEHLYTCACVDPECPVHGVHFVHGVGRSKVVVCPVTGQRRGRDSKSAAEASGAILADAMCAVARRAQAHTHTQAQLSQGLSPGAGDVARA